MKVAIDVSPTVGDVAGNVAGGFTVTGVGSYTYHLVRELVELDAANDYRLVVFKGRGVAKPFPERRNVHYRFVRFPPPRLYVPMLRKLRIPLAIDLLAGRSDVFVFPNFVRYPLWFTKSSIVFVYDLSFLHFPEFATDKSRDFLARFVPASIQRADHVFTISEFSKREIIAAYGAPEGKITVAEPGVDLERFHPVADGERAVARERYGLPESYLLSVGTLEPRKNVGGLLAAFRMLPARLRREYPLVVTGGRGWREREIVADIEALAAKGEAVWTGYVPKEDLTAIYAGATLFVFPSFYEGWGMPVVEAMACGVPVVTSSSSSLPEAAGDAAVTVDPHDSEALAAAIERVLENGALREQMVRKGLEQASRFSWRRSAEKLLGAIEALDRR